MAGPDRSAAVLGIVENRYLLLLATLLALFALHPFADMSPVASHALSAAGLVMVVVAVRAARLRRRSIAALLALGLVGRVMAITAAEAGKNAPAVAGHVLGAMFLLCVAGLILVPVLRSRRVTMDMVLGTACTTVGYGDVSPLHPTARVLSMLEALVGQLYVAIVIAHMVGLKITHGTNGNPESD